MKKLFTLLFLVAVSLSVSAQDTKEEHPYSDYTACSECFEDWKVSESASLNNGESVRTPKNKSGKTKKPFKKTYVGTMISNSARVIVGSVLMITTAVILTQATKPTIQ